MDKTRSKKIISILSSYYGDVKPGLDYVDLYQLTISVILSAQTTDRQVNTVTPVLFKKYPGFHELSKARISDVEKIIRSTGFFRNKSKNIVYGSRHIMDKHGGRLPENIDELMSIPGVGRKSANVIISMGFHRPAMAVDTHVLRLSNRLGYAGTSSPLEAEKALQSAIPAKNWILAHLLLIKHGRTLCRARNPLCGQCPVSHLCEAFGNTPYMP